MTPIALSLVLLAGALVLVLPRNHALKPLIAGITLIPMGSVIYIGPANFHPMRMLVFFGMVRVLIRGERLSGPLNGIDICMILWSITMLITGALLPKLDTTFITRLGEVYDAFGLYFMLRLMIRDENDIFGILKTLPFILMILAIGMLLEKVKGFNFFSLLGGVTSYPAIRDGKLRCQGPFASYILAGTVGAVSIAWYITAYLNKIIAKYYIYVGIASAIMIVLLSNSSGPIMSSAFCILGLMFWPLRNDMKVVQKLLIITLVFLHLIMESPVWFLIAKIDLTGSSTGWHRAELIDSAIRHFNEWWLLGTAYTRHWMPTGVSWSPYQTDITNQYIKNGVNGGLLAMVLFIFMISNGFKIVGKCISEFQFANENTKKLIWSFGATLFSHTATFFSVRYFDQSMMYFYMLLAMLSCAPFLLSKKTDLKFKIS